MPTNRLVIPLLNVGSMLFPLPKWHLTDAIFMARIDDQDFATLHREADGYSDWLKASSICVHVEDPEDQNLETNVRTHVVAVSFVFNAFASAGPLVVSHAAYLEKTPECKFKNSFDLHNAPAGAGVGGIPFTLRTLDSPEPIINLFKIVQKVVGSDPAVLVTLDRFNTSLTRSNIYDQIIDITISLESIVESSTEIKFRFSLYNALVSEPDPTKRRKCFKLLQDLYDARSAIVHGDVSSKAKTKLIAEIRDNMKEVQRLAVAVISYYLLFLFKESRKAWKQHLDDLALGIGTRTT